MKKTTKGIRWQCIKIQWFWTYCCFLGDNGLPDIGRPDMGRPLIGLPDMGRIPAVLMWIVEVSEDLVDTLVGRWIDIWDSLVLRRETPSVQITKTEQNRMTLIIQKKSFIFTLYILITMAILIILISFDFIW